MLYTSQCMRVQGFATQIHQTFERFDTNGVLVDQEWFMLEVQPTSDHRFDLPKWPCWLITEDMFVKNCGVYQKEKQTFG